MKTTQQYFKMSKEELQEIRNEYGYTLEECKLLDESENTIFYNCLEQLENDICWYKNQKYEIGETIAMTDGRFALLLF